MSNSPLRSGENRAEPFSLNEGLALGHKADHPSSVEKISLLTKDLEEALTFADQDIDEN
jgi:hypothetical protein